MKLTVALERLERQQAERISARDRIISQIDAVIADKQLEIDNLRAQLEAASPMPLQLIPTHREASST